tara:strand:+ start:478 stop:720 length:243 start_codon:yes stop_codon:yes gene_type:complete
MNNEAFFTLANNSHIRHLANLAETFNDNDDLKKAIKQLEYYYENPPIEMFTAIFYKVNGFYLDEASRKHYISFMEKFNKI